jgi:hypothetical protein
MGGVYFTEDAQPSGANRFGLDRQQSRSKTPRVRQQRDLEQAGGIGQLDVMNRDLDLRKSRSPT